MMTTPSQKVTSKEVDSLIKDIQMARVAVMADDEEALTAYLQNAVDKAEAMFGKPTKLGLLKTTVKSWFEDLWFEIRYYLGL